MQEERDLSPSSSEGTPDIASSLGYGQPTEYHYLNVPTRPLSFAPSPREQRLKQLREERLQRRQSHTVWTIPNFFRRNASLSGQKIDTPKRVSIGQATLIISGAMIASRFLGLLRSFLFVAAFKAGHITDAYVQASLVPDLIYTTVTGGALMSAFIPVFNTYMVGKRDEKAAWHIASSALNIAMAILICFVLIALVFTRQMILPYNLGASESQLSLITTLTRIMLLQSVVMGAGVIINSVLTAQQDFVRPAIGAVLYNIGLIIGLVPGLIIALLHHYNDTTALYSVNCAVWGIVLGALLMVGVQVPGMKKVGMQYSFVFSWRHPGVVQIGRQMVPRVINSAMLNLSTAVDRILISFVLLVPGLLTQYSLTFSLVLIPLSLVMAVATAAFPTMTEYVAQGHMDHLCELVLETLRSVLFVSIPSSIGLMVLSMPVIQVMYEHAQFTFNDAQSTTVPLFCFAIGLPGLALIEILTRSFYALRQSTIPVVVSVGQFIFKIALSLLLIDPALWLIQSVIGPSLHTTLTIPLLSGAWGMGALAFATSIAVLLEAALLLWLLRQQLEMLGLRALLSFVGRVLAASLAMSVSLVIVRWILDTILVTTSMNGTSSLTPSGILLAVVKLGIEVSVGSFVYLRIARFIHLLNAEKLGPVNRLLIRLHLSWV